MVDEETIEPPMSADDIRGAIAWLEILSRDVAGDNDRSSAITMATMVDDALSVAIDARLVPISKTLKDRIYSDAGALGSFNAKIDMGFALGLYGIQTRSDLHLSRRIRNKFAHTFAISTFVHEEIAPLCMELKTPDYIKEQVSMKYPTFTEEKLKYFLTTMLIHFNLNQSVDTIIRVSPLEGMLP